MNSKVTMLYLLLLQAGVLCSMTTPPRPVSQQTEAQRSQEDKKARAKGKQAAASDNQATDTVKKLF